MATVQNIPYTLTIWNGNKQVATVALPNGPSQLTWKEDFPTTIEYTLGPNPKREHNVPKRWTIEVSGRTGVTPRPSEEGGAPKAPLRILDEFAGFLERYQELAAKQGAVALSRNRNILQVYSQVRMEFVAPKENIHMFVEPGTFTYDRNAATTRQSAAWALTLVGWQHVRFRYAGHGQQGWGPPFSPAEAAAPADLDLADTWAGTNPEGLKAAREVAAQNITASDWKATNDAILAMRKRSAEGDLGVKAALAASMPKGRGGALGVLDSAFKTSTQWVKEVRREAQIARIAVQDFRAQLQAGIDILRMPQRAFLDLVNSLANFRAALTDVIDAGEFVASGLGIPAALSYLKLVCSAEEDATVMLGAAGGKVAPQVDSGPQWSTQQGGLQAGEASYGSVFTLPDNTYSWADVSIAVYGTADFWMSLAKFNAAVDAYTDKNGKPLAPGDAIYIPAASGKLIDGTPPVPDDFYLVDMLVGPDGDLVADSGTYMAGTGTALALVDSAGQDLLAVSGYANLIQAVVTRSRTPLGALSDRPDYGMLEVSPGDAGHPNVAAQALVTAQSQLLADFRIAAIENASAILDRDTLALDMTIIPAGMQPEPLEVVVPLPSL